MYPRSVFGAAIRTLTRASKTVSPKIVNKNGFMSESTTTVFLETIPGIANVCISGISLDLSTSMLVDILYNEHLPQGINRGNSSISKIDGKPVLQYKCVKELVNGNTEFISLTLRLPLCHKSIRKPY
ncbi:hypothetical protein PACTADRAFT_3670 [Pachysolen tannophilus NRRL Y-2460]|uniref:Uncharacterized protein n=1 Tax=Pachysolen tannophilus NRRL Y-2460 TaxID=669874 RepID=A0A1E4TSQ8_PACTA|nr:hypothetical protein PACTADRAFT_3670 [Pachysolen tannophilus NRRL Y-2460]